MKKTYLRISPEVEAALAENRPVVALESTIISHGMPYPQNVETALEVDRIIREKGVVPATIGVIHGEIIVGMDRDEITYMGKAGLAVRKLSRPGHGRGPSPLGLDGATTQRGDLDHRASGGHPDLCDRRARRRPPRRAGILRYLRRPR